MKIKKINIILLILVITMCILLLYFLFNNKHADIYNKMNEIILKEKFKTQESCTNGPCDEDVCISKQLEDCGIDLQSYEPIGSEPVQCESSHKYQEYISYLDNNVDALNRVCIDCDEKREIIETIKRVKCLPMPDNPI